MGCDIHAFVEVQDRRGKWYLYNQPDINRDYELFGRMAKGVRHDSEYAIEPRGLPKDISIIVGIEAAQWDGDAHTHSYLCMEEMRNIERWYRELRGTEGRYVPPVFGYLFGNSFIPESLPQELRDARLVFWFDN